MISYFLKRLLLLIPTLWVISIVVFFMAKLSPGDPILDQIESSDLTIDDQTKELRKIRAEKGLDLPLFYFSVHRKSFPDTLHRIGSKKQKKAMKRLAFQCGSWEAVDRFYSILSTYNSTNPAINRLHSASDYQSIIKVTKQLDASQNSKLINAALAMEPRFSIQNYLPALSWYGFNNQYHLWFSNLIQGKLGTSITDQEKVSEKISKAIGWTVGLSFLSILLACLIAIPAAVYAASKAGSKADRILSTLFFGLYAIPNFWLASLLLLIFAGGAYLDWFPLYGTGEISSENSFWESLQIRAAHLTLPVVCYTYGSLAFLYRQLRRGLIEQSRSEYFLAAAAKGLNQKTLWWKHAFKNVSLPLITILGAIFPAMISGSFVIEYIFNIPGMGKLAIDAFLARDYPTIFGIVMIGSALTLVGFFIADLLYQRADPRIQFEPENAAHA